MGVRHSKPKTKRRFRSRSIGKRQNPEGGYSNELAPTGSAGVSPKLCPGTCPCNKAPCDVTEEGRTHLTSSECKTYSSAEVEKMSQQFACRKNDKEPDRFEHFPNEILKVGLPPESNGSTSPQQTEHAESKASIIQSRNQSEWTITLDDGDNKRREGDKKEEGAPDDVKQEEISRLLTSIREFINHEVRSWSAEHSQVHVHLSVSSSGKPGSSGRRRSPAAVPNHEPTPIKSDKTSQDIRVEPPPGENVDRRQHYRLIPGVDNTEPVTLPTTEPSMSPLRERTIKRAASSGKDGSRSCSRDKTKRHCQCRRHSKRCHDKSSKKYQSPFDQGFQEAMYLRLKELQLKTSQQAEIARRAGGVDGERDDVIKKRGKSRVASDSDSEYSGDEDGGGVLSGTQDTRMQVSRMFEPLSEEAIRAMSGIGSRESSSRLTVPNAAATPTAERQAGGENADKKLRSRSLPSGVTLLKPWDRTEQKNVKKKKTKTRKKKKNGHELSSKAPHGYLRANTMPPGAISQFPNTPKAADGVGIPRKAPAVPPQRHQHEHYHHHYYYQCEPET